MRRTRWDATERGLTMCLLLIYPGLATRVFRVFRCISVGENENAIHVLQQDYNIACYGEDHMMYVVLAVVFMCVYILGGPLLILYELFRNRKHLHDESSPKHKATLFKLGGLYQQYEPAFWVSCLLLQFSKRAV